MFGMTSTDNGGFATVSTDNGLATMVVDDGGGDLTHMVSKHSIL